MATVNITSNSSIINPASSGHYGNLGSGPYTALGIANQVQHSGSFINTSSNTLTLRGTGGKKIVELTNDGKVIWGDDVTVDEAAEAFSQSIKLGAELIAGLTVTKQQSIRNTIFEEIIKVAQSEGPLDADKLEFMLKSCKIMDALKNKEQ